MSPGGAELYAQGINAGALILNLTVYPCTVPGGHERTLASLFW